jgi:hypothetical protein
MFDKVIRYSLLGKENDLDIELKLEAIWSSWE